MPAAWTAHPTGARPDCRPGRRRPILKGSHRGKQRIVGELAKLTGSATWQHVARPGCLVSALKSHKSHNLRAPWNRSADWPAAAPIIGLRSHKSGRAPHAHGPGPKMGELEQYDYHLPKHLIAQHPARDRLAARLLVVDRAAGSLEHRHVRDLPEILRAEDCLVINDTRVLPAKLLGRRVATGGRWDGLFLEASADGLWRVLGKTRGRLQPGEAIVLLDLRGQEGLELEVGARLDDGCWAMRPKSKDPPYDLLQQVGRVPLPPYIRKGEMVEEDRLRYQTVYARVPGAVAAPTAGLHFTHALLCRLQSQGVRVARLTLHVGPGTFRPITTERLADHKMHAEWGNISPSAVEQIEACRARGGRVVAVGTTVVRLLETAAASGPLRPFSGQTDLFIRPPFEFRVVDALMTNFHLPRTTLLVLVHTFGGNELIRRAYEEAIRHEYRFYSYGDAMLIL